MKNGEKTKFLSDKVQLLGVTSLFRLFPFLYSFLTLLYPKLPNIAIRQLMGVLFINSPNLLRRTSIKLLKPLMQLLYQLL